MDKKSNDELVCYAEAGIATERVESADRNYDARRRALMVGLAAVPVLLTLRSRSVFAQPPPDCSVVHSIQLDAGTSLHPGVAIGQPDINRCQNK